MSKLIQDVNIGSNIQKLRKRKGLSQTALCARLDLMGRPMIQTTLAQIETGARNIFVSDLLAIKTILGATFEELFDGLEPINKYENM